MKKSKSSMPRFDARFPGLAGIGGPDLVPVEAACSLVAIAVGNTLELEKINISYTARMVNIVRTTMGLSYQQTCEEMVRVDQ
jgi:hypothetical protein